MSIIVIGQDVRAIITTKQGKGVCLLQRYFLTDLGYVAIVVVFGDGKGLFIFNKEVFNFEF